MSTAQNTAARCRMLLQLAGFFDLLRVAVGGSAFALAVDLASLTIESSRHGD